jgi:hypothetical protein
MAARRDRAAMPSPLWERVLDHWFAVAPDDQGGHRMVMEKIEPVQEYRALITQEILDRYDGVVRVWDTPRSAIDGGQVLDKINQPLEVVVSAEEKDLYGSLPQRAKVRYGDGKEGWVLYQMLAKRDQDMRP